MNPAPLPTVSVALPYTCGELVQGYLNGQEFHLPCPIERRGMVSAAWTDGGAQPRLPPSLPPKTRTAVRHLLEERGRIPGRAWRGLSLRLPAGVPCGKGLGSSSVDVLGALLAVSRLLGEQMSAAEVTRRGVRFDPTDGIAFPGLALADHRRGSFHAWLGWAPRLGIVVLEPKTGIDTIAFHRHARPTTIHAKDRVWEEAVAMAREGLEHGVEAWLGQAATLSARRWQRMLDNPWLDPLLDWAAGQGALGVCRAHSGTVLGVLFASDRCLHAASTDLRRRVAGRATVWTTRLANGGVQ